MNIRFLPLKVAFESTNAAIAEITIYIAVVTTVTKRLLKIYLESGTCKFESRFGRVI